MNPQLQTMIDNMPEKTGKSLAEWTKILHGKNFAKHGEAMKFLKGEHGVTHGFANTIVALSKKEDQPSNSDLVSKQYEGKAPLRPIYDMLLKIVGDLGDDVTITPKKASVSIIRKKQFLLIKPATKTRIDLGLKIKNMGFEGRLENSGPFGTMCTHRVKVSDVKEIDNELLAWIKEAYDQST